MSFKILLSIFLIFGFMAGLSGIPVVSHRKLFVLQVLFFSWYILLFGFCHDIVLKSGVPPKEKLIIKF